MYYFYSRFFLWVLLTVVVTFANSCVPAGKTEQARPVEITDSTETASNPEVVIEIESESQFLDITEAGGLCFVVLYSEDCGPCHFMDPIMAALAARYLETVTFCRVNIDRHYFAYKKYKPKGYPLVLLISRGREFKRFLGPRPAPFYMAEIDKLLSRAE